MIAESRSNWLRFYLFNICKFSNDYFLWFYIIFAFSVSFYYFHFEQAFELEHTRKINNVFIVLCVVHVNQYVWIKRFEYYAGSWCELIESSKIQKLLSFCSSFCDTFSTIKWRAAKRTKINGLIRVNECLWYENWEIINQMRG